MPERCPYPFLLVLLLACSGDATSSLDAGPGIDAAPCDPLTNTGCADNLSFKCTWLRTTETMGYVGCAPWGDRQTGQPCIATEPGEYGSSDNCVGGNICIDGVCRRFCEIPVSSCAIDEACTMVAGYFDGEDRMIGVCAPDTL